MYDISIKLDSKYISILIVIETISLVVPWFDRTKINEERKET